MNRPGIFYAPAETLIFMLVFLAGCSKDAPPPVAYTSIAMEGWVVDSRTRGPLKGVIVTAHWEVVGLDNERPTQLTGLESVTDAQGRYYFPAWGPKPRPEGMRLSGNAPHIVVFKNGYAFKEFRYDAKIGADGDIVSKELSGLTIGLEPFFGRTENSNPNDPWYTKSLQAVRGAWHWVAESFLGDRPAKTQADVAAYAKHLGGLQTALAWAYEGKQCEWKQVAGMVTVVHHQAGEFRRLGIESDLKPVDVFIPPRGAPDPCGARERFDVYLANTQPFRGAAPTKLIGVGGGAAIAIPSRSGK